jgi:hypothetical protein
MSSFSRVWYSVNDGWMDGGRKGGRERGREGGRDGMQSDEYSICRNLFG